MKICGGWLAKNINICRGWRSLKKICRDGGRPENIRGGGLGSWEKYAEGVGGRFTGKNMQYFLGLFHFEIPVR